MLTISSQLEETRSDIGTKIVGGTTLGQTDAHSMLHLRLSDSSDHLLKNFSLSLLLLVISMYYVAAQSEIIEVLDHESTLCAICTMYTENSYKRKV